MKTSMVLIQSYARGCLARSLFAKMITIHKKQLADKLRTEAVITMQSYTRRWSAVKNYKELKNAVINIQQKFRCLMCLKAFKELKFAAVEIQRLARGQIVRNRMLGACFIFAIPLTVPSQSVRTWCFCLLQAANVEQLELCIFCISLT